METERSGKRRDRRVFNKLAAVYWHALARGRLIFHNKLSLHWKKRSRQDLFAPTVKKWRDRNCTKIIARGQQTRSDGGKFAFHHKKTRRIYRSKIDAFLIARNADLKRSATSEEDNRHDDQNGEENTDAVAHIAKEAGHFNAVFLRNRFDHEVWPVADVGHRAHKDGA